MAPVPFFPWQERTLSSLSFLDRPYLDSGLGVLWWAWVSFASLQRRALHPTCSARRALYMTHRFFREGKRARPTARPYYATFIRWPEATELAIDGLNFEHFNINLTWL